MTARHIIILLLLFITINSSVYFLTEINTQHKVAIVLKKNLNILKTHHDILLESQTHISYAISKSILRNTDAVVLLDESYKKNKKIQHKNRSELNSQLKEQYETAKNQGVLQLQFVFPNNVSFLRVHKPSKFGDDLTDVREDYKYTNETHKPIRGFTQGRTAHGFRNIFPMFNKNGKYVGAMEISFSSERFQWYLNHISQIHSHFLVNRKIFDAKTWERNDLVIRYQKSAESKDYMFDMSDMHSKEVCIVENKKKLEPVSDEIEKKMNIGESFSLYVEYKGKIEVQTFLPIKNLSDKTVAWILGYSQNKIIEGTLLNQMVVRVVSFIISILLVYLLVKQIISKKDLEKEKLKVDKQHKIVNDILNATENIMFITDFKNIKFANSRFKSFFDIETSNVFNRDHHNNLLHVFLQTDGFLHAGLLQKSESFIDLVRRTPDVNRVVSIMNKNFKPKSFMINITKTHNDGDYLVTLSDITEIKEQLTEVEGKVYIDGLTQVHNRNKFNEALKEELTRVAKYDTSFSVALIDIDKFKDFNDVYGHLIGDEVLITMAQTVKRAVRETDTFARWGGEEFVILFKDTILKNAETVSEKLRVKIQENEHPTAGKITASFGITQYKEGDTLETIFKRCDDALYIAKENGRNRVEILE